MAIKWEGLDELQGAFNKLKKLDLTPVFSKQISGMWNRSDGADARTGGTPYDTGDLKKSRFKKIDKDSGEFGYNAEHAPHVEFGHRTRGGGFVAGQYYLKNNFERQKKIFNEDVKRVLKELK